jgi:UV DNA damage repair endonuclease
VKPFYLSNSIVPLHRGADLAAAVLEASKDAARCGELTAALNLRKTLVTNEILTLSSTLASRE